MAQKRKISIRKVLQVLLTLVVTGCCITAILSASKIENEKKLTGIDIQISNGNKYHFIDKPQIMDMIINNRHIDVQSLPIGRLDTHSMEGIIDANPWVANAEVFIDNTHVMHIIVTQRVPVARLFDNNGNSYYLDTTLTAMPLSTQYIHYTTIVTNVPELKEDSLSKSLKGQIVSLVRYISMDTFWSAQIAQVSMDTDNTFELTPVLGNQRIVFGDTSRMKDKFDNLFLFYKKVLNRIGWDKYQVLDVRFKDQVVASPSLPSKGPVDKSMSSMNWVKNIIESGVKNDPDAGKNPLDAGVAQATPTPVKTAPVKEQSKPAVAAKQTQPKPVVTKPAVKTVTPKTIVPKAAPTKQVAAHKVVATKPDTHAKQVDKKQVDKKTAAAIVPQHKTPAKTVQTKKTVVKKEKTKITTTNKEKKPKEKTAKYIYQ